MDDALREAVRLHRRLMRLEAQREQLLAARRAAIGAALVTNMATDIARALGVSTGRLSQILTMKNDIATAMTDADAEPVTGIDSAWDQ